LKAIGTEGKMEDKPKVREKILEGFADSWRAFDEYINFDLHKDDIADGLEGIDKLEFLSREGSLCEKYEKGIQGIFRAACYYFELNAMPAALSDFRNKFEKTISAKKIYDAFMEDESGEILSRFLIELREFLYPLGIWKSEVGDAKTNFGLEYLENILKHTAYAIIKMGIKPKNESEVYNAIKVVINSIYPSSQHPKSLFTDNVKEYKPDILIPELEVAIEYKYANSEEKVKTQIEQVYADVAGYSKDTNYSRFYAVFYCDKDYLGSERLKYLWETRFPPNWKYFQVIGPMS
jgi:hypothetical protein